MKTMAFAIVGNLILTMHNHEPPSVTEWNEYVVALKAYTEANPDLSRARNIVFTDGGAPNSAQRKEVNDILQGRHVLVAVVSSSTVVRGVVTAFAWFNPDTKGFAPDATAAAYAYLQLSNEEVELIQKHANKLRAEFSGKLKSLAR
jgi:hypothetical protein